VIPSTTTPVTTTTVAFDEKEVRPVRIFHDGKLPSVEKEDVEKMKGVFNGRQFVRGIAAAIEGLRKNMTESFDWVRSNFAANNRQWSEIQLLSHHVSNLTDRIPPLESQISDVRDDVRKLSESADWLRKNVVPESDIIPKSSMSR